jgi:hypothetical protein
MGYLPESRKRQGVSFSTPNSGPSPATWFRYFTDLTVYFSSYIFAVMWKKCVLVLCGCRKHARKYPYAPIRIVDLVIEACPSVGCLIVALAYRVTAL